MNRRAVFSIAPELPFLDALVAGLLKLARGDPLALARMTVLLPTRRAVRSLGEAFLRQGKGKPLLLPRLMPVGDLDAEELGLLSEEADPGGGGDIPPAIPEATRRLKLARLVLAWGKAAGVEAMSAAQAAPLAAELARFLDEAATEGCDFAKLADLAPERHAAHWQQVLQFLAIVTEYWPKELAALGGLDPASRRNRVLQRQAEAWTTIAARAPGHRRRHYRLGAGGRPNSSRWWRGCRSAWWCCPGSTRSADQETWEAVLLDPTHPQHLLARLLALLEVAPKQVRPWPAPGVKGGPVSRAALIKESLRPADVSHRWGAISGITDKALAGMLRVDCPGPQEEATVIALLLRQKLETPGATAALVTPDRDLARRVAGELRRWGIEIDEFRGRAAGRHAARRVPASGARMPPPRNLAPLPLSVLVEASLGRLRTGAGAIPRIGAQVGTRRFARAPSGPGLDGLIGAVKDSELKDFVRRVWAAPCRR